MSKRGGRDPVHIRRNLNDFSDSYIPDGGRAEICICKQCGAIYRHRRWVLDAELTKEERKSAQEVVCPACQKIHDGLPNGVVTLEGKFLKKHREEILNLIHNEEEKAKGFNPLERIMNIAERRGTMEITTTSEKLAQRIGRVVHKAYSGEIDYRWSEDVKLARVYWRRDE